MQLNTCSTVYSRPFNSLTCSLLAVLLQLLYIQSSEVSIFMSQVNYFNKTCLCIFRTEDSMTGYEEKNWNILVYNVSTLHFSRLQGLPNNKNYSFIHST